MNDERPRPYDVHVVGQPAPFRCRSDQAVLVAMERTGHRGVPVGCRGGGCGFCKVRVLSGTYRLGKMSRRHVTEAEQDEGWALACRLYPTSNLEIQKE